MQKNSLVAAIRQIRGRLHLRQSDLAERLGCRQNTISKYELGKAHPGIELLVKLWGMADASEQGLIQQYLYEQFSFLPESERRHFTQGVLSLSQSHFSTDLAAVLSRAEAPEFLRTIASLYLRFRKYSESITIFEQATTWLSLQFQMVDYEAKTAARPLRMSAADKDDDCVGDLLREAAAEPLVRETKTKSSKSTGQKGPPSRRS